MSPWYGRSCHLLVSHGWQSSRQQGIVGFRDVPCPLLGSKNDWQPMPIRRRFMPYPSTSSATALNRQCGVDSALIL